MTETAEQAIHSEDQHDGHLRREAHKCGVLRRALKEEGFSDDGAEAITLRWYDYWCELTPDSEGGDE